MKRYLENLNTLCHCPVLHPHTQPGKLVLVSFPQKGVDVRQARHRKCEQLLHWESWPGL